MHKRHPEALSVFGKDLCDRPDLDQESQHAITAVGNHRPIWAGNSADNGGSPDPGQSAPAESTPKMHCGIALCMAHEEGAGIGDLTRVTA